METKQLQEAVQIITMIKPLFESSKNEWLPVVAAIGGAFVGGISAFIPNYLIELKKRRDERRSVKSALLAEVAALVVIVETRQYIAGMEKVLIGLRANPGTTYRYFVKIPSHYSRIYQSHIERIGVLEPPLAAKIIQFHQLVDSIVQDIAEGGAIAEQGGTEESFEQLIEIANKAMDLGQQLLRAG